MQLATSFPIKPVGESQRAQRIPHIWLLDLAVRSTYRIPQGDTQYQLSKELLDTTAIFAAKMYNSIMHRYIVKVKQAEFNNMISLGKV